MTSDFTSLPLQASLIERLHEMNIKNPTAIQVKAIPLVLEGKSVIAQSQTGTGKTLAYLLPILQKINTEKNQLQAVILVPTRELGMQIHRELEMLTAGSDIRAQQLIGGASVKRQIEKLRLHPHIVVATPGRILELIRDRKVKMHEVRSIVVDEADQVFALGNVNVVKDIFKSALRDIQILFFSATIPPQLKPIADQWMNQPVYITSESSEKTPEQIEHLYFVSEQRDKIDMLRKIVRTLQPKSAIVFTNDVEKIAELIGKLQYIGLSIEAIYSEAAKQDRARVLKQFREGKLPLLLASDVAARGIDIQGLTHVINFDLPIDADHYIHRAGRTGRMGRDGTVISIATPNERWIVDKIAGQVNITIEQKELSHGEIKSPQFTSNTKKPPVSSARSKKTEPKKPEPQKKHKKSVEPSLKNKNRHRDQKMKGAPRWLKDKGKNND